MIALLVKGVLGLLNGFILIVLLGMLGVPLGPIEVSILLAFSVVALLFVTRNRKTMCQQ
jgi:hypothetical protein